MVISGSLSLGLTLLILHKYFKVNENFKLLQLLLFEKSIALRRYIEWVGILLQYKYYFSIISKKIL